MSTKGEMLLLAAAPKVGKSLLATDIAYSVLSGTKIFDEIPHQGKVLYINSDESDNSLRRRLYARGFDSLLERNNFAVLKNFDLTNLNPLEEILHDFQPDLVIIDSLTSISMNSHLSENDAEFAKLIYKLKNVLKTFNAASILIHHENKVKDAKDIEKVAGSSRIPAAVWGVAQLKGESNTKLLHLKPREGEKITCALTLNIKDTWSSDGIFKFVGIQGNDSSFDFSKKDLVQNFLQTHSPRWFSYTEINNHLNIGNSLYKILDRLCDRQIVSKRKCQEDKRKWLYSIPTSDTPNPHISQPDLNETNSQLGNTTNNGHIYAKNHTPPPPQ